MMNSRNEIYINTQPDSPVMCLYEKVWSEPLYELATKRMQKEK